MQKSISKETSYRWFILILGALTNSLATAAPSMCMPVLFKEISGSLDLSLVQIGMVWGVASLPGIVTVLIAGAVGDRFGPRRIIVVGCVLAGLAGALRGMATDLATLTATVFLLGFLSPFVQTNVFRTIAGWFSRRELGLANGVLSMGMALGFLIGSLISATVLSPWLGGWRNVLFFYGAIAVLLCIPWAMARPDPQLVRPAGEPKQKGLTQAIAHVGRIRNIWLMGLVILGIGGCIQGSLGYLPLYLRGQGWTAGAADSALALFHTISMIGVIPIALGSDQLGSRKRVLLASTLMITCGIGLLSFANGVMVWLAVCMAGVVRDGFMAVFQTAVIEIEGIGPAYAGTASGMVMVFGGISSLISPIIGNSLAATAPGLPFIFWSGLTLLAFVGLFSARSKPAQSALAVEG